MARTLMSVPPTGRVGRYPKHIFNTVSAAYTLQPFMIAPVLPGETLQNLFFESRVITDSVVNPIIGWKKEYYYFYVRVTDLLNDAIRDMFIDPANADLTGSLGVGANDQAYYTAKGGIDYVKRATQRVWETYFADEGDSFAAQQVSGGLNAINGVPFVQIRDRLWLDSITDKDDMPVGVDPGTVSSMEQLEAVAAAFEQLRALGIANMTYEDFLRSYGIAIPNKDEAKPELLARFSDFQYPSNTVDPATGVPTSACSWVFKNSARDPKFFKEPGFIVGFSVTRPKVYFGGLAGNLTAHLSRAWDWLPNYLNEAASDPKPFTALKKFGADTGPLGDRTTATDAYWIDMRDLFIHGDQYFNRVGFNPAPVNVPHSHLLALPPGNDHSAYKYPNLAMVRSFFLNESVENGLQYVIRQDGYVTLSIKGRQVDYTVGNIAEA